MKTILRIILILLVACAIAEAISLAVNNNTTITESNNSGQPPAITGNGQFANRPERGDHEGGAGGFAGVIGTLAKLTGITILVLALQKGFSQLGNRRPISTGQ